MQACGLFTSVVVQFVQSLMTALTLNFLFVLIDQPPQEELPAGGEGEEGEEEDLVLTLRKFPRTPQPWESLGSEVEVEEENVTESRPKVSCLTCKSLVNDNIKGTIHGQ